MRYFYASPTNQPIGPHTIDELKQFHLNGTIRTETWVLEEGGSQWQPYANLVGPGAGVAAPVPMAPAQFTPAQPTAGGPLKWWVAVMKNYAGFSGRARRKEFWMFGLFNFLFLIVAMILDNILGTTVAGLPYGAMYLLYTFAVLIPGLAVTVRRLHDGGKSGWFLFVYLIPIIGAIWVLIVLASDSSPGTNKYGPNPKGV
jgi:uncharacterized membrane protein YhaH (DUF805 family)